MLSSNPNLFQLTHWTIDEFNDFDNRDKINNNILLFGLEITGGAQALVRIQLKRAGKELHEKIVLFYQEELKNGKSYREIYFAIEKSGMADYSSCPFFVPMFMGLLLRPMLYQMDKTMVPEPVHGPFEASDYDDPAFVSSYIDQRFDNRVDDVVEILRDVPGPILALGDGAGTAFAACSRLNRTDIVSFDPSNVMVALARDAGRVVSVGDHVEADNHPDHTIFLSHVLEYMPDDFLERYVDRRIVVFEKRDTFPGSYLLTPYDKRYGRRLSSRNVRLRSIALRSYMQPVYEDDRILGVFATGTCDSVHVALGMTRELDRLKSLYPPVKFDLDNPALVVPYLTPLDMAPVAFTPAIGVINTLNKASKLAVPPAFLVHWARSDNGYISQLARHCGKSKIAVKCDYAVGFMGNSLVQLSSVKEGVGDTEYTVIDVKR